MVFLQELIEKGTLIPITTEIKACRDSKDDKYLELAAACGAACIITGGKDLLTLHPFRDIPILTPVDFLAQ